MNSRDEVEASESHESRWVDLPPTGWGALVALLAGPKWARTASAPRSTAKVVRSLADGTQEVRYEDLTDDESAELDDDIAEYITRYGLAPPPRGVIWQLRIPTRLTWVALEAAVIEAQLSVPEGDLLGEREAMRRAIDETLGRFA